MILPAGTAAIPAALPPSFNHRPYQRQTRSLMAQYRPSDQRKGPCITFQTALKYHPLPRLQQHTAKALIPLLGELSSWQGAPSVSPQKPNPVYICHKRSRSGGRMVGSSCFPSPQGCCSWLKRSTVGTAHNWAIWRKTWSPQWQAWLALFCMHKTRLCIGNMVN